MIERVEGSHSVPVAVQWFASANGHLHAFSDEPIRHLSNLVPRLTKRCRTKADTVSADAADKSFGPLAVSRDRLDGDLVSLAIASL
jgi:hypothetical protein